MPSSFREFLFDYEPQDEASSPSDYAYLIILRHLLSVMSCWPLKVIDPLDVRAVTKRKIWVLIQRTFHLSLCLISAVGSVMYILLHIKSMSFFQLGHIYISMLMTIVIFSRITTLCFSDKYTVVSRLFLEKMHLFFYKDRSEFFMKGSVPKGAKYGTLFLRLFVMSVCHTVEITEYALQNTLTDRFSGVACLGRALYQMCWGPPKGKTHKQVHQICHIFTLNLTSQMFICISLFNITPMYNNYSAGNFASGGLKANATYEHALYFSYPFNVSTELKWYIFANILHWIISYLCASWFFVHDCFLSMMVFHIWGHFKILLYNLDNFPRPSSKTSFTIENSNETFTYEMFSPDELKHVSNQLNELIDYHREIVTFTDKISHVFGPMLLVYYGFHQASGCLLLLECSQMTAAALIRYLPLTITMFQQLMQLSIIFELIGSISDRLKASVYGLPWECMDAKNRRTVAFFLMNVQEPIHVKALGLANVGVTSMTAILKTSLSYFTFLNSM